MDNPNSLNQVTSTAVPPADPTWGVIIIHGVGETSPGKTLEYLSMGFEQAKVNLEFEEPIRVHYLPEDKAPSLPTQNTPIQPPDDDAKTDLAHRFPMHYRWAKVKDCAAISKDAGIPKKALFAEVYWADLSHLERSLWMFLFRAFTLVFNLHYLSTMAAVGKGWASDWLRCSVYMIGIIISGPIAGLHLFLLYFLICAKSSSVIEEYFGYMTIEKQFVPIASLVGGLLFACLSYFSSVNLWPGKGQESWKNHWLSPWPILFFWSAFWGLFFGVIVILDWAPVLPHVPLENVYCRVFLLGFKVIGVCFTLLGVCTILAITFTVLTRRCEPDKNLNRPQAFEAALTIAMIQIGLWVIAVPVLAYLSFSRLFPGFLALPSTAWTHVIGGFLLNLFLGGLVLTVIVILFVARYVQYFATRREQSIVFRLIANPVIVWTTVIASIVGTVLFVFAWLTDHWTLQTRLANSSLNGLIVGIVALSSAIIFVGRFVLRIILDVVMHFYCHHLPLPKPLDKLPLPKGFLEKRTVLQPQREDGSSIKTSDETAIQSQLQSQNEEDITADQWNVGDWIVQQQIESRFRRVLQEVFFKIDPNITHLTIIAHSQGSMVAINTLWLKWTERIFKQQLGPNGKVYLATMGSPFSHLYQYYFPARYPAIGDDTGPLHWGKQMQQVLNAWINVHRRDDYIGMQINGCPDFPKNEKITHSGHTGYWHQAEFLNKLNEFGILPGSSVPPPN